MWALKVVTILKEYAEAGANINVILHQPSQEVFEKFDQLVLLGSDAKVVYSGPRAEAQNYFKKSFPDLNLNGTEYNEADVSSPR